MKEYSSHIASFPDETIELALPVNPAYVSAARLTASSIANRMGFDIELIEDIKAAVSEACTFLIKKSVHTAIVSFKIKFNLSKNQLEINLIAEKGEDVMFNEEDDQMGLMMIKALMDEVVFNNENGIFVNMVKKLN